MFIRKKRSPNTPNRVSIQIVESVRKADKISQTIVKHIGIGETEKEIQELWSLAESIKKSLIESRQPSLPLFDPQELCESKPIEEEALNVNLKNLREEQRYNEGIIEVFGKLYDELGFNKIFKDKSNVNNSILKSCVLARLANPSSKLRTSSLLEDDFAISLPVQKIYRMMTRLGKQSDTLQSLVKSATLNLVNNKVNVLLYDVTTLYFESFRDDELRDFGFSKDCKFKEVQVVLSLVTTEHGLPIQYQVFPGNTQEIKTLMPFIEKLKKDFTVENIDFAADRGMFSQENIKKLEEANIQYVVAAKLKNMSKDIKEEILKVKNENPKDEYKTIEITYKDKRLIVAYSPTRAKKDKQDRERLVKRLAKFTSKDGNIDLKKLVNNQGTKKYLKFNKENSNSATINSEKIELDSKWDGIFGYITNSQSSADKIIERYKNLWVIEDSFRINKHDLKIRPIFHFKQNRIKAHLDICFLTYALARQMMYRYRVQFTESLSFDVIRNELLAVQASLLVDIKNKDKYIMPSKASPIAKKLYKIMGIKKSSTPYKI
ncbi:IS1634 family transposase [Candidatus Dojkabacteria bacterium]|uniref:IS1634 family transposase n=1 Tax=Candidatus Dojkabacteria bacterium TaxID=2099670 RepID=A0A955RMI3_9BACT|nr:IS1634 family transposase [Candidatus Dojkabacteria bacterium]